MAKSRRPKYPDPSPTGLIYSRLLPSTPVAKERAAVKARQVLLSDLVGNILVGPPNVFPIRPATGQALFDLAVDWLAKHDRTTAKVLRHYAAFFARLEQLELRTSTEGLPPVAAGETTLKWLLSESSMYSTNDLRDGFGAYRRAVGKRICQLWTLRRQDQLLRAYGRANNYPAVASTQLDQRTEWARKHLKAMIAEAQVVPCWNLQHGQIQDLNKFLEKVRGENPPLANLSALVLAKLHQTTPDYLLKRLLPRRRSNK